MQQNWQEEWQALIRYRDEAFARSRRIQAEITASFRRKQPPTMELLREADVAESDLAAVKVRLRDFLQLLAGHGA